MNKLVDVHAHFVTPWYVEQARAAGHERPDGMPGWPDWSPASHLRMMDELGIDEAVLSISSPGVHFGDDRAATALARRVNEYAAEVCAAHPDRFRFFASLPVPAVDAALAELAYGLDELGAAGVAMETNVGGRYLSDPLLAPVLDEIEERGAVLFVHPTSPPGWETTALGRPRPMIEFLNDTTRTVADLVLSRRLTPATRTRLIVPHCGGFLPLVADRLQMFAGWLGDGAPLDVAEVLRGLWYDLAGTPVPTQAETLVGLVGSEHLLYGSDHCWTPAEVVAAQVAALDQRWDADRHGPWRDLATVNAGRLLDPSEEVR